MNANSIPDFFLKYMIGPVVSAVISLISVPILTRIMQPSEYGKGMMYVTIINLLFCLCNCGTDQAFVRFYYESKTQIEKTKLLYSCLAITLICLILLFFILYFFQQKVIVFFFGEPSISLFYIVFFGTLVFVINRFMLLSIRMQQKAFLYSFCQIFNNFLYFTSLLFLIFITKYICNFKLIIYAQIFSLYVTFFILLLYERKKWSLYHLHGAFLKKKQIEKIFYYSWPFIFSFVLIWAFQSIDRIFILKWSNYTELGIYSAAFSLAAPMMLLQTIFTTMWSPIANKNLIENPDHAKKLFCDVFRVMFFILIVSAILVVTSKGIFVCLLGAKYRSAIDVFVWLLFVPLFYLLSEITIAGIIITKKSKWSIHIAAASLLTNLIGCYFLIPHFGAKGAAISLAISYLFLFVTRTIISFSYYTFFVNWLNVVIILVLLTVFISISYYVSSFIINLCIGGATLFCVALLSRNEIKYIFGYLKPRAIRVFCGHKMG